MRFSTRIQLFTLFHHPGSLDIIRTSVAEVSVALTLIALPRAHPVRQSQRDCVSQPRVARTCLQTRFSAPEVRQKEAHSVSCGLALPRVKSSGGATEAFLPLLRSSPASRSNPGLTPGATVFRCSAAGLKALPRHALPWETAPSRTTTPTGLRRPTCHSCHNPVGVGLAMGTSPKVVAALQPWANGQNPIGIHSRQPALAGRDGSPQPSPSTAAGGASAASISDNSLAPEMLTPFASLRSNQGRLRRTVPTS
jgi:hypothetical protein